LHPCEKYGDYLPLLRELAKIQTQTALFPERKTSLEKLGVLRASLFKRYEFFINRNNEINDTVARTIIQDWFKRKCNVKTKGEVSKWISSLKWERIKTVFDVVEIVISSEMKALCFQGGCEFCPQTKGGEEACVEDLVSLIVTHSDKYRHVLQTTENLELLLNGGSQFVKTDLSAQEDVSSPIEKIMYEALIKIAPKYGLSLKREHPVFDEGRLEIRYSLDIALLKKDGSIALNIECDGLSFHRGNQNMSKDRSRDRWLLMRGIPVMRFTSRDILNDLRNCVVQVESVLQSVVGTVSP